MDAKQQTQFEPDIHNLSARAEAALELAQTMPSGPDQIEALKKARTLRNAADVYEMIFAGRFRSLK